MPPSIGAVVSSRYASLIELQTAYGVEDLYLLIEIIVIDSHNQKIAESKNKQ